MVDRRILWAILGGLMLPYAGTLAWTGAVHGEELRYENRRETEGKYRILLDSSGNGASMDLEEYLPGVIARQIPADYEPEALKAQAIIARTYIRRQMEAGRPAAEGESAAAPSEEDADSAVPEPSVIEIPESALDMDYAPSEQLKKLWGTEAFPQYYQKLEAAVKATKGLSMTCDGAFIDPVFCLATAGKTRAGDTLHPYLQSVDCPEDATAKDIVQLIKFSKADAAAAVNSISTGEGQENVRTVRPEAFPEQVQIVSRDEAGYVEELQIDGFSFTGEEVQYALKLPSSCFSMAASQDGLRVTVRGIGHGYGLSQTTAQAKAKEGWTAQDILTYFYKKITFVSE